jgi:5-methylcytosine-specific restriction protein A
VTLRVCNVSGCPTLTPKPRCPEHERQAERTRGTAAQRGYGTEHRKRFREGVLAKHPFCQVCRRTRSTVADHWPLSKRELDEQGMDSNDPQHGRGLCHTCHSVETAQHQPGGFRISPRD